MGRTRSEAHTPDGGDPRQIARHRLARLLLGGADLVEIEAQAEIAQWPVSDRLLVLCASSGEDGSLQVLDPASDTLAVLDSDSIVMICNERTRDRALEEASAAYCAQPIAVSLPTGPTGVPAAARMVHRAQRLTRLGLIRESGIIDCAEHEATLWLHSEPELRERLTTRLLAPLVDETPHRRMMLALTLLGWLETRESAPALAAHLGVHPQTVRHRMRRLEHMLGEQLHDDDARFAMLLALKATLPLWRAGVSNASDL